MPNFVIISGKRSAEAEPYYGYGFGVLAPVVHAVGEDGKLVGTTNFMSFLFLKNIFPKSFLRMTLIFMISWRGQKLDKEMLFCRHSSLREWRPLGERSLQKEA